VLVLLILISLLNTISVESLFTFLTTTITLSYTLNEYLTTQGVRPETTVSYTLNERLTTQGVRPETTVSYTLNERLTTQGVRPETTVSHAINEYLLTRYTNTTVSYSIQYTANETLPAHAYTVATPSPVTSLPTYAITNPYKSGLACNAVNPTRISDTLYQYNTSGLFYILVNNTDVLLNIYPNNYGQYQAVCESLYYCGFRAYASAGYSNKSLLLLVVIPQLRETIRRVWSDVVDAFELYLTEQTRDFSGIGSLIVWELHITIYSNNTIFTEQDIPLWSVFYQSTSTLLPFPVSIYSNNNNILVYDCAREWITAVCPSNNPVICALWGFFKIIYDLLMNILPPPVRSVFSLFGVLGGVLTSILSVFTNPLFLSIVLLLFPLLLLTLVTHETVERGGFGLINVFNELFSTIKHIVELIINMIRSVLPF